MIEIDGSHGEGGGQVIRTALTMSAITGKPASISRIRAGRPNPGLQPQHLMACKAVRSICRGTLKGAEVGSPEVSFEPGPVVGGKYDFDIGTAGSVTLVAQTIIPILLKASKKSHIRIRGGTHVMKSPGFDYFERVFIPAAAMFGAVIDARMVRPGYYPKGGGEIGIEIEPSELHGCSEWRKEERISALIRLSGLPSSIAVREKKIFVQRGIEDVHIREDDALSPGNAVTAWRGFRGAYALGERGKRAEVVAAEAIDALRSEEGDVDLHLADQLLIYAALAEGGSVYRASLASGHLRTNAHVVSRFLDRRISVSDNGEIMVE